MLAIRRVDYADASDDGAEVLPISWSDVRHGAGAGVGAVPLFRRIRAETVMGDRRRAPSPAKPGSSSEPAAEARRPIAAGGGGGDRSEPSPLAKRGAAPQGEHQGRRGRWRESLAERGLVEKQFVVPNGDIEWMQTLAARLRGGEDPATVLEELLVKINHNPVVPAPPSTEPPAAGPGEPCEPAPAMAHPAGDAGAAVEPAARPQPSAEAASWIRAGDPSGPYRTRAITLGGLDAMPGRAPEAPAPQDAASARPGIEVDDEAEPAAALPVAAVPIRHRAPSWQRSSAGPARPATTAEGPRGQLLGLALLMLGGLVAVWLYASWPDSLGFAAFDGLRTARTPPAGVARNAAASGLPAAERLASPRRIPGSASDAETVAAAAAQPSSGSAAPAAARDRPSGGPTVGAGASVDAPSDADRARLLEAENERLAQQLERLLSEIAQSAPKPKARDVPPLGDAVASPSPKSRPQAPAKGASRP